MKKTISFSLWGDAEIYKIGLLKNYEFITKFLSDYKIRIYVDRDYKFKDILYPLCEIELIEVESLGPYHGMYWRFGACEDSDVVLVRDLDSRITVREVQLVREWEFSNKMFHIIHDHPLHKMPIMGGVWGCYNGLKNINQMILDYGKYDAYGYDQVFLKEFVFPLVKDNCLEHTSNGTHFVDNYINIPKTIDGSFVGERISSLEEPLYIGDRYLNLGN